MTQFDPSSSARRGRKPLWGWVALVALTQMGMSARGCFSVGDGDIPGSGGSGGGSSQGCDFAGQHFAIGASLSFDSCNSCSCTASGVVCTQQACAGAGGRDGGGAGGIGGVGGIGGTAGWAGAGGVGGIGGTAGWAGAGGVGGIAGSGGIGGVGGLGAYCSYYDACQQVPCVCLDQDHDGQCDNHCPSYECVNGQCIDVSAPRYCGGLLGTTCLDGQYCKFSPATQCGSGDQTGECTFRPEICDDLYSPVCGCDGKTYANACNAAVAGVSVQANGACPNSGPLGVGDSCGGFTAQPAPVCGDGLFCQYQAGALCGAADAAGECVAIPTSCPTTGTPVCGCNGITYANACAAARAQMGILDVGRCQ